MKNPEEYGSIIGINKDQYNRLVEIIKEAQKDAYNCAMDYCFNSTEKMNAKFNKEEY